MPRFLAGSRSIGHEMPHAALLGFASIVAATAVGRADHATAQTDTVRPMPSPRGGKAVAVITMTSAA